MQIDGPQRALSLAPGWVQPHEIEQVLLGLEHLAESSPSDTITLHVTAGTRLLVSSGLRLLAYLNQLCERRTQTGCEGIHLQFDDLSLFGYLDRNGFLRLLDHRITTHPIRPETAAATLLHGSSPRLVEIAEIDRGTPQEQLDQLVPSLVDGILSALNESVRARASTQLFSALGELVNNVLEHSETSLPGFAMLQVYPKGSVLQLGVSDSGVGIPASMRPALRGAASRQSDEEWDPLESTCRHASLSIL